MDFSHKTASAEIKEDTAAPHIDSESSNEHKQNSYDDAQNSIFEQNKKTQCQDVREETIF